MLVSLLVPNGVSQNTQQRIPRGQDEALALSAPANNSYTISNTPDPLSADGLNTTFVLPKQAPTFITSFDSSEPVAGTTNSTLSQEQLLAAAGRLNEEFKSFSFPIGAVIRSAAA